MLIVLVLVIIHGRPVVNVRLSAALGNWGFRLGSFGGVRFRVFETPETGGFASREQKQCRLITVRSRPAKVYTWARLS